MWRNSAFIPTLLLISATSLIPTHGVIHTGRVIVDWVGKLQSNNGGWGLEGGSFTRETDQPSYGSSGDYDVIEMQRTPTSQRQLASIVDELPQARNSELSNEEEEEGDVVPLELLIEAAKQQERDAQLARERAGRNAAGKLNSIFLINQSVWVEALNQSMLTVASLLNSSLIYSNHLISFHQFYI
jgi:hypothetical protein